MLIWSKLETTCPMCSHRLPMREVGGGFVEGQDSDLLIRMSGKHLIQADIHTCLHCGFSGYLKDFLRTFSAPEKKRFKKLAACLLAEARDLPQPCEGAGRREDGGHDPTALRRDGQPQRPLRSALLPDVQYWWASQMAEELGLSPTEQGLRLVRAFWCTRLAPTNALGPTALKERRKTYLRRAIQRLRQGLRSENDPHLLYLIGEVCRRNGNFLLAESYFRRFLQAEGVAQYLNQVARKLIVLARNKDSSHRTMEGLLYGNAPT